MVSCLRCRRITTLCNVQHQSSAVALLTPSPLNRLSVPHYGGSSPFTHPASHCCGPSSPTRPLLSHSPHATCPQTSEITLRRAHTGSPVSSPRRSPLANSASTPPSTLDNRRRVSLQASGRTSPVQRQDSADKSRLVSDAGTLVDFFFFSLRKAFVFAPYGCVRMFCRWGIWRYILMLVT